MTRARRELIDLDTTPYYHCICRCVRRAFLCGEDHLTGKSYEHRKPWVIERLATLANVFAIDLCAYAVMSNHYHLVLRVDQERAAAWSEEEVMNRWRRLFHLPLLVERYRNQLTRTEAEHAGVRRVIALWRKRLADLGWYMRSLNEHLARRANEEDRCKGRFWEGRYKSQALLDEAAVLTCMSYVDLNPIRAGIAETPETSDYTSIQQRIHEEQPTTPSDSMPPLVKLTTGTSDTHRNAVPFALSDYLELVDWTGRAMREDKRGHIPAQTPPILARLGINEGAYLKEIKGQTKDQRPVVLGHAHRMKEVAERLGRRFIKGIGIARTLYPGTTG